MPLLPPPAQNDLVSEAQAQAGAGGYADEEDRGGWRRKAREAELDADGFRPEYFAGDWVDNLGHCISVLPMEPKDTGRRRGRDGGRRDRVAFLAVLSKPGVPDKRFTIAKDRSKKEWTCGNGTLMREESGVEVLSWQATDGRISTWSREGCVYFDEPPMDQVQGMPGNDGMMMGGQWMDPSGMVFCMVPQVMEVVDPSQSWETQQTTQDEVVEALALPLPALPVVAEVEGGGDDWRPPDGVTLRASAPEFVPTAAATRSSAGCETSDAASSDGEGPPSSGGVPLTPQQKWARTPTPSPLLYPQQAPAPGAGSSRVSRASPKMGPAPSTQRRSSNTLSEPTRGRTPGGTPQRSPQLNPVTSPQMPLAGQTATPSGIELSEDAVDVQAFGSRLEWAISDSWGKLSKLPQEFCITSSMFGVKHAPNMQLAFYPNGVKSAERDHCTVVLTRGPNCAGIKFEFLVNGRGIGPKVCLGRRYMADYPRPYDDAEASKPQKVVICMQVLEILGAPAD